MIEVKILFYLFLKVEGEIGEAEVKSKKKKSTDVNT